MSITYNSATLDARLNAVIASIDAGASFGKMRLLTATAQTVCLIVLNKPCATASGALLTFSGLPLASSTLVDGDITAADIEDSNGTVVASGLTVGNSTAFDIVMSTTTVISGNAVSLNYATITGR